MFLQCFDTVGWVIYNVFGGTLSLTQSINQYVYHSLGSLFFFIALHFISCFVLYCIVLLLQCIIVCLVFF